MRTKINIISWLVFLVLLHHMTQDKPLATTNMDSYRIQDVQKVAYKRNFKIRKGVRLHRSSRG